MLLCEVGARSKAGFDVGAKVMPFFEKVHEPLTMPVAKTRELPLMPVHRCPAETPVAGVPEFQAVLKNRPPEAWRLVEVDDGSALRKIFPGLAEGERSGVS